MTGVGHPFGVDNHADARAAARAWISVTQPGLLATVQDLGRPGRASQGIARSGALDRGALRIANRLLGNAEGAAGVEITMGGFSAVLVGAGSGDSPGRGAGGVWVAVTGAQGDVTIDGRAVGTNRAVLWPFGARLDVGMAAHGVRFYLGVRGGIDAPVIAGSRATDVMAGLGLAPLTTGDALPLEGACIAPVPANDLAPWGVAHDRIDIELWPGPRADWFAPTALETLFGALWLATSESNRVGMRLAGPELARTRAGELPSEGMVVGAVQVPPSGAPTVLLADGPVTGGYPVIAVVAEASLDRLAQARPGQRIAFRHASP